MVTSRVRAMEVAGKEVGIMVVIATIIKVGAEINLVGDQPGTCSHPGYFTVAYDRARTISIPHISE